VEWQLAMNMDDWAAHRFVKEAGEVQGSQLSIQEWSVSYHVSTKPDPP
jgi:hypothetical protein